MTRQYSRRDLYALGEPLGESVTRNKVGGGRIYGGGGGGGFLGDIVSSIGDAVSGAVQAIGSGLAELDHTVNNVIPGGWMTVGAATLMAVGIYDPELLAAADEGTLTGDQIVNAGYDASTVSGDIANLSTDAINAGFTDPSVYADATLNGFSDANTYYAAQEAGFVDAGTYEAATNAGFTNAAEFNAATEAGFTNAATYNTALNEGFTNAYEYNAATNAGFQNAADFENTWQSAMPTNAQDYYAAEQGGFQNSWEYNTAKEGGFTNRADWMNAFEHGISNSGEYETALSNGTIAAPGETLPVAATPAGPVEPISGLENTAYAQANGLPDPNAVQSYLNQGYSPDQITQALNDHPQGGWAQELMGEAPQPVSAPVTPTTPVTPQAPVDIASTGISDSAPGTVYTNQAGAQEIVLDSGKTVNLADYQAAQATGNPISVDGTITTSTSSSPVSIEVSGLPGTVENPPPIGTTLPEGTQLATVAQQTEAINGVANGAYYDMASGSWVIPQTVAPAITASEIIPGAVAVGGTVAATSGGAGAVAPGATTAPVTTAPVTTAPVTTPPVTTAPVTTAPVTTPPVTTGPVTPVETPVVTTPPATTPPVETPPPVDNTPADLIPHHDIPPADITTEAEATAAGYDAATIAKWVAAGYIAANVVPALLQPQQPSIPTRQPFPIPTFNGQGLVNPGVNPGFVEPAAAYNTQQPGMNQYYWGQHNYAQNMSDLANLNSGINPPGYGNPNAVNLGHLVTPEQLGYPTLQTLGAAQGTATPSVGAVPYIPSDVYHNTVQMNTVAPQVVGTQGVFGPVSPQQMAVGHGPAQQLGQALNYVPYPFTPLAVAPANAGTVAGQA